MTTFFFFFFESFFDSSLAFFLSTFDFFLDDSTLSDFLDFLLISELFLSFLSLSLDFERLRVFFLSFDEERDRLRFDFDLERLKVGKLGKPGKRENRKKIKETKGN